MGSGHILGHLLWQSGLPQRSELLLIRCLLNCPSWSWPQLFHLHAALGQMHLCFPHPSCLPGHGRPCYSADRPHGLSRLFVSVGSCCETGIQKCDLNLSSSLWLGIKPLSTCSLRGESRLPTDLLLVHRALQPSKGVSLPSVRTQDLCVQYMARTTPTQGISPTM